MLRIPSVVMVVCLSSSIEALTFAFSLMMSADTEVDFPSPSSMQSSMMVPPRIPSVAVMVPATADPVTLTMDAAVLDATETSMTDAALNITSFRTTVFPS